MTVKELLQLHKHGLHSFFWFLGLDKGESEFIVFAFVNNNKIDYLCIMETKICSKCGNEKSFDEFNNGNDKNGLEYRCKKCISKYNKERYNPEYYKEYCNREDVKKRQKDNSEYYKEYRQKNKERIKIQRNNYLKKTTRQSLK